MSNTELQRTLRVLHVEDAPSDRELVAAALRREGLHCEFAYAANEQEFRKVLDGFPCDLILSDFTLPSFSGAAALALAKSARPDVPFLFVSGTIGEERAVESLRRGATDYVLKAHLDRLGPAVRRALREARDRVERHRAEQLLRASEERFRQVVENIREVFWLTDPYKQVMLYISPAYEKIWGRSCDSLQQSPRTWIEAIHPEDRERILDAATTRQNRGDYDEVYRIIRPDGSMRWIHDRAFPLRDAGGGIYRVAGIAEDITEKRDLELQLRQAQKMESIGQLAGGVAHDFNNVLAVIQGHASVLALESTLTAAAKESVNEIALASERAARLTRQLLTFSRRQVIQMRELNLNDVIEGIMKMLRRLLGEDVVLQFTAGEVPPLLADAGMLEQVLMNLAVNARDAMRHGGTLAICTGAETIDEAFAERNPEASAGRFVCLEVADTGCGIPPENLPKIFEPFFTTKEVGKGTGLGLATVYGIVKQHRGWITLQSEVNRGTKFKIHLPATSARAGPARTTPVEETIRGGAETILVVEDEPPVRDLVCNVLETYGYRVLQADSGDKALEQWEKHQGQIDLLFTDLVMPGGMNGRQLAEALRAKNPGLKVVFSSGYTAEIVGRDFHLRDGINFLQKPYPPRMLASCVRSCLDTPHARATP
jgi:two-component system cell cycle sensor histidine kinase/response regulator CckA